MVMLMVLMLNKVYIHLFILIKTKYDFLFFKVQPSPCQGVDGPHALAVSNGGFIMCDGERLFVESCPGGTIWDDLNKACVWPDMQTTAPQLDQQQGPFISLFLFIWLFPFLGYGYGQQRSGYGSQLSVPKLISSYGGQAPVQQYGGAMPLTRFDQPKVHHHHKHMHRVDQPKLFDSYGAQINIPQPSFDLPKTIQSYGGQQPSFDLPKTIQSYGGQQPSFDLPKTIQSYGGQQPSFDLPKSIQSYGSQQPSFDVPKPVQSYGGY
jgi:hypothetical protein